MSKSPRIVFLGTPEFAVPSLEILVQNGFSVVGVVTAPDKPAGRGQKLSVSPVKKFAVEHDIPVLQPVNLKDPEFLSALFELNADLQIVVAFRMLPEAVWNHPPMGTFNLHASLLPQYRGAAPINWAIINGEMETGITTFFLQHEIDTGRIIFQEKVPISSEDTAGSLHDRLMLLGSTLVLKTVQAIAKGKVQAIVQDDLVKNQELKLAPKLNRANTRISIRMGAEKIHNLVRGLNPHPTAYAELSNPEHGITFTIKVYKTKFELIEHHRIPGSIETDQKTQLSFYVRDGIVHILELQLSGRNKVLVKDFLNGVRLEGNWTLS